jgi:hypothetical protein
VNSAHPSIPTPGWLFDELGYAGRENLDASHVGRYDALEDTCAASEVVLLKGMGLARESVLPYTLVSSAMRYR